MKYKNSYKRTWDWLELQFICHSRFGKRLLKRLRRRAQRKDGKKQAQHQPEQAM